MSTHLSVSRNRLGLLLGVGMLSCNLFSAADLPVLLPAPDDQINLVCLGDSHTENGVYAKTLYESLVKANRAAEKLHCYGFGGRTAADLTALIKGEKIDLTLHKKAVNVLCLMVGTNGFNVPDLKALVEMIGKRGWRVVVLTTPPCRGPNTNSGAGGPGSNGAYNDDLRKTFPKLEAGKLQSVQLVDIVPPLLDKALVGRGEWTDTKYSADRVHLNAEGYTLIGKTVADALLTVFPKK